MAGDEEFSEEYIAELLKKDAQKVSASYARSGIYDVLPKRPTGTAPKPNTRFLQSIIRSTDSHNAALKQKELGDAASRLRALTRKQGGSGTSHSRHKDAGHRDEKREYRHHKRKRDELDSHQDSELGDQRSIRQSSEKHMKSSKQDHARKRRRSENHDRRKNNHHEHSDREESLQYSGASATGSESGRHSSRRSRKQHSPRQESRSQNSSRHDPSSRKRRTSRERKQSRHYHQSDNESESPEDKHRHSRSHRKRAATRSPSPESSASDSHTSSRISKSRQSTKKSSRSQHTRDSDKQTKHRRKSRRSISPDQDLSDDPLTPFLGPLPPDQEPVVRVRGRGATSAFSGTDQRFSASYDPAADTIIDNADENEDWDQALDALRDRQRFRQVGVDRLLAAGFSKDEVARMERGGEKDETDVRWTKKGQAREWDRGKVLDEDGNVTFKANRLGSEL